MPLAAASPSSLRLFLALWPEANVRAALREHQSAWCWPPGAAPTVAAKLHMTLHFLGEVAQQDADALAALPAPAVPAFTLHLQEGDVWRGGVAVLRPTGGGPLALHALHAAFGARLAELGLPLEDRPFAPHVTLARKASGATAPEGAPAVAWPVRHAVLVASLQGRYEVMATWTLDGHGAAVGGAP